MADVVILSTSVNPGACLAIWLEWPPSPRSAYPFRLEQAEEQRSAEQKSQDCDGDRLTLLADEDFELVDHVDVPS